MARQRPHKRRLRLGESSEHGECMGMAAQPVGPRIAAADQRGKQIVRVGEAGLGLGDMRGLGEEVRVPREAAQPLRHGQRRRVRLADLAQAGGEPEVTDGLGRHGGARPLEAGHGDAGASAPMRGHRVLDDEAGVVREGGDAALDQRVRLRAAARAYERDDGRDRRAPAGRGGIERRGAGSRRPAHREPPPKAVGRKAKQAWERERHVIR